MEAAPPFSPLPSHADVGDWRKLLPVCLRKAHRQLPADPAAGDLLLRFTASARSLHEGFMRVFGPARLTEHKFIVLVVLSALDPEPSSASQLAVYAGVTRASMTKVLDGLERCGRIKRVRNSRDRRTILVQLTPGGRSVICEAASRYLRIAAELVRPLDVPDLAAFARICARLHTAAKALPGDTPRFQPNPESS
jgi:DNA-binding MarR family transcriptional regulator